MARVRIPDNLRDRIRKYNNDAGEYSSISDFAQDAIRRLLEDKEQSYTRKELEEIVDKRVEEELG